MKFLIKDKHILSNSFHTIIAPTEGLYKEKGSKFIDMEADENNEDEKTNIKNTSDLLN